MLRIVKTTPVWQMDANGHVLDSRFFREVRREGATIAELSPEQWKGYFGKNSPDKPMIDGMLVRVNSLLEPDEVQFYHNSVIIAKMRRLYVVPEE